MTGDLQVRRFVLYVFLVSVSVVWFWLPDGVRYVVLPGIAIAVLGIFYLWARRESNVDVEETGTCSRCGRMVAADKNRCDDCNRVGSWRK